MTVKYLLLDIDGVLTNARDILVKRRIPHGLTEAHRDRFCAGSLNLIKMLIDHADLKVVIFSTWAARWRTEDFSDFFGFDVRAKLVPDDHRGKSVERWLNLNPQVGQTDFVIFDDNKILNNELVTESGISIHTQFVHIKNQIGVTISDIDAAAEKLGIGFVKWPKIFF